MDNDPKPPRIALTGEAVINAIGEEIDIGKKLREALPMCFSRIEAMDYAGAFSHFTEQFVLAERTSPIKFLDESAQKLIRQNLKRLWTYFLNDITDRKKFGTRLDALRGQTEAAVTEIKNNGRQVIDKPEPISTINETYNQALAMQQAKRRKVIPFPNDAAESAHFQREFSNMIDKTVSKPVDDAFAPELTHMAYIGELFNVILPLLRRQMEGYVKPLVDGKRTDSNYVPVTAGTIKSSIIDYLALAPSLATTFATISEKRWDAAQTAQISLEDLSIKKET